MGGKDVEVANAIFILLLNGPALVVAWNATQIIHYNFGNVKIVQSSDEIIYLSILFLKFPSTPGRSTGHSLITAKLV